MWVRDTLGLRRIDGSAPTKYLIPRLGENEILADSVKKLTTQPPEQEASEDNEGADLLADDEGEGDKAGEAATGHSVLLQALHEWRWPPHAPRLPLSFRTQGHPA